MSEHSEFLARVDYKNKPGEIEIYANPLRALGEWISLASHLGAIEPMAMSLATVSESGHPDNRMILMRHITTNGITFFTNYTSKKGEDLEVKNVAAACFWWPQLERQIRIRGAVKKMPNERSDAYFSERPAESKVSAIVSQQSRIIPDYQELMRERDQMLESIATLERPEQWGGYELCADEIELWYGMPGRLHLRHLYRKNGEDGKIWNFIGVLAP